MTLGEPDGGENPLGASVLAGYYPDPEHVGSFRFWTGEAWGEPWAPSPGYYRSRRGVRYWDGAAWGRRYWTWWRIALTATILGAGAVVGLGAMAAMLGDPGPGGDTADFERDKGLGALFVFVVPLVVVALLAIVHLGWLTKGNGARRVRRRRDRLKSTNV